MKNIPELRFTEFSHEWEIKKLNNIVNFSKGKSLSKSDISSTGIPCILYGELYTTYGEVIRNVISKTNTDKQLFFSKKNDVIIPSSGENAEDISCASAILMDDVALGGDLNVLRPKKNINGSYLSYILNSSKKKDIARIAQGASVVHLYSTELKKLEVNVPSIKEQTKIAEFFTLIDEKLEKQQKKIEQVYEYKKGMMKKIFNQEVRFKNERNEDYPEWEDKKLRDILTERKTFSTKGKDIPHGSLSKEGVTLKTERYNRDFLVRTEDKKYKVTYKGDICYNPANLKFGVICQNNFGTIMFSPIYVTFKVDRKFNDIFMGYYVTRPDFINKVRKYEEGTVYERIAVKPSDFLLYKAKFPSLSEQNKIASFLSTIDKKIEIEKEKLEELKVFKKGLMQKMFI